MTIDERYSRAALIILTLMGLGFIFLGCYWLWDNERSATDSTRWLRNAEADTMELPGVSRVDASLDGRLVHATGTVETDELLRDDDFNIRYQGIKLVRKVQFYQWVRHKRGKDIKYEQKWVDSPGTSGSFRHENIVHHDTRDATWVAKNVTFGAYSLHPDLVGKLVTEDWVVNLKSYDRIPAALHGRAMVDGDYLYIGADVQNPEQEGACTVNPAQPGIGDVRIQWLVVRAKETASIVAKAQGSSLVPYIAEENGQEIGLVSMGEKTAEEMYDEAKGTYSDMAWGGRLICWLPMALGVFLLLPPLNEMMGDRLLYGSSIQLYAVLLAVPICISVVVVAFAKMENLIESIGLLLAITGYAAWLLSKRKRKADNNGGSDSHTPGEYGHLLRAKAASGQAEAQHELGECYELGNGVKKDEGKAVEWYRKAAGQGYAAAQYNLGECYQFGIGVASDKDEAAEWYRKAAEQGYAKAQHKLGYCYQYGMGVGKDAEQAAKWFRTAKEHGYEE